MSEFDELENMFSDAFSDEKVTPPKSVKQNIDRSLFGSNGRVIWLFALLLLLLLPIGGVLIYNQIGMGSKSNDKIAENHLVGQDSGEVQSMISSLGENERNESVSTAENQKTNDLIINAEVKGSSKKIKTKRTLSENFSTAGMSPEKKSIGAKPDVTIEKSEDQLQGAIWNDHQKADLLSLTNLNDRPLPYDLLMMCATKPIQKRNPISLDVYAGVEKGFVNYDYRNKVEPLVAMDRKLSEDLGVSLSLEMSYPISGRLSVASGIGMHRGINTFSRGSFGVDSTYTGDTLIVTQYFDTVNQVQMTDSTYYAMYDLNEYEMTETTQIMRTSFFLPIYLKYERTIGYNWRVGASFGVRLSYDQIKLRDNMLELSVKDFKRFGMSAILRPEVSYQLNKWNFGAYGQLGYDMLHGLSGDITRVNRYAVGGGIRFRYTF